MTAATSAIARSRDGLDQRLAGGEVDVDRRAHDARPASDLGHAGLGIARQGVDGRVEDPRDAALGVGAAARRAVGVGAWRAASCVVDGDARARAAAWAGSVLADGRMTSAIGAGDARDDAGGQERVPDARAAAAAPMATPAAPAAIVASTAMPSEPPISWPVVFRPESIPASSSPAPVSTATDDRRPARARGRRRRRASRAGRRRRSCRPRSTPESSSMPAAGDGEPGGERDAHAGVADQVAGERGRRRRSRRRAAGTPARSRARRCRARSAGTARTAGRSRTGRRRRRASSRSRRRSRGRARRWTRSSGWAVRSSSSGEGGQPGQRGARRCRASASRSSRLSGPARGRRRAPPRLAVASSAPRRSRPRQCGRAASAGQEVRRAGGERERRRAG